MERYATLTRQTFTGPVRVLDAGKVNPDAKTDACASDGLLFTAALREAHNAPDLREDKIKAIKAAIANGTYAPDARKIALALVRDEMDLFY